MIKVPQLVKDRKQVYLQLCICPKADSEVIGMCLLASGFSFGLLRTGLHTEQFQLLLQYSV